MRDLLAVDVDPAAILPADDSSEGFDNIADALAISPALVERYAAAASKISRLAVGNLLTSPSTVTYRVPERPFADRPYRRPAFGHSRRNARPPHLSVGRRIFDQGSGPIWLESA